MIHNSSLDNNRYGILYLPASSPHFSPIEETFSKPKTFLRRAGARTGEALQEALAQGVGMKDTSTASLALSYQDAYNRKWEMVWLSNRSPSKEKSMKNTQQFVLLFDGSCNFCTACAELLYVLDWRHRLQSFPFQGPGVPQAYGLTIAQCERAAWVISPTGRIYREAQAVNAALDAVVVFPCFLLLYRVPGIRHIEDKVYAWVAKNRRFLPGIRPYCDRPSLPCGV